MPSESHVSTVQSSPDLSSQAVRFIAITSGKGGVGKTMCAVNLAVSLSRLGQKVLIIDSDFGLANADILLGINPERTLLDAMFGKVPLEEIIVETRFGVSLLPAGSGSRDMVTMNPERLAEVMNNLKECAAGYDMVLFDCAAGVGNDVMSVIAAVPETLIVATPQPTSLIDAYALMKLIHQESLSDRVGLVLNMVGPEKEGEEALDRIMQVVRAHLPMDLQYLGSIPLDHAVVNTLRTRSPLVESRPDAPAAHRIKLIAQTLLRRSQRTSRLDDLDAQCLINALLNKEVSS